MTLSANRIAEGAAARLGLRKSEGNVIPDWHKAVIQRTMQPYQLAFIESQAKRIVVRGGRRGGKTTGLADKAIRAFLAGRRVLYATPTADQITKFWYEMVRAFGDLCDKGILYKNETEHIIEVPKTLNRIRAKTAWNANTLRGDYADLLILDEWQLMNEDAWGQVGAPMLLDNNGDAVFIYTPPSLHSRSISKATDVRHAAKLFKRAQADDSGRWAAFHFTSHDNKHISEEALAEITSDMTALAYQQEIMAEDTDEAPGALWKRALIEQYRVFDYPPLIRVVVGVDPPGGATECGIVTCGLAADGHAYVLADDSLRDSPQAWSMAVVKASQVWQADRVLGEKNYGGDMVEHTIRTADGGEGVSYKNVQATRGKAVRAEPVAALYERGFVHHVGEFAALEDEQTSWIPNSGMSSPNRMDALVWCLHELLIGDRVQVGAMVLEDAVW